MDDLESRLCAQTQQLNIIKTFYMSQINPNLAAPASPIECLLY